MLRRIKNIITNNSFEDICVTGFIDIEDGVGEFHSDMQFLYFKFGDVYIEFQGVEQFSLLKIKVEKEILYRYNIDRDMIKAKMSIDKLVLVDTLAKNNIETIKLHNVSIKNEEYIICEAVEVTLESGKLIFIDPSFYDGFGIGGIEQKVCWEENHKLINTVEL